MSSKTVSGGFKMNKIFTEYLKVCLFTLFLVLGGMSSLYAANRYAVANGNWNSTSTWSKSSGGTSGASVPVAGDNVYIERGYTVTVTANAACTNLYFSTATTGNLGTLTINNGVTLTVSGEVTLNNAPSDDVSAIISGAGTLSCANLNIGNNTDPSSSFGKTVVHSLTSTITQLNISQNLTVKSRYTLFFFFFYNYCNGIFIQNSGTVTVNGSVVTNNENSGNSSTLTLGNFSPTLNIAGSTPFNLSGTGTNTITLNGTSATVNYNGAAQQILATTYTNLTLSGTGAKTFPSGTTTVNNVLSIENGTNTNTFTGTLAYGTSATLQYNAGTSNRTVSTEWPATFSSTGGVIVKGTGTITLNEAKTLGLSVPLNITAGATLATSNYAMTFGGDFINNGTFTAGSSNITIANTATTQSIAGFTTTGNVSMTKTSGTATFTGNVSAAGFSLNGTGGTLNCGSGLTHTFTGTFDITAGTLQGGSSTIKINGTPGTLTGSWEEGTSTVDYGGASQIIFATTYYNLVFSSGTKSLSASANISIKGNFTNNATFTYGTSTVTFNGTSPQTIGGSKATTFYNLTINNTGTSGNNTVTLQQPTTVTNVLTLTSGIVNTTSTNLLYVINTMAGAISGGSSTAFVNGPLKRNLPINLSTGTNYFFPVGAETNYYPFTLVNPITGADGGLSSPVQIEAKAANCDGTFDRTLFGLSTTEYWTMTTTGSFTNSSISISRPTAITPYNVIAGSTAVNGAYTSLGGTAGTYEVTNSSSVGSNRYFVLGEESNYWLGSTDTDWGEASNWTAGYVPLADRKIVYATVDNYGTAAVNDLQLDADRTISSLINATNKKLIIPAAKALTVNNTITISDSQNADLILIKSGGSSTPQGTLIFHNDADHPVYATVEMYSKAWIDPNGATNNKYFWQYFGLPFRSLQANPSFYGAYVRKWDETGTTISNHWVQLGNNDVIQSFLGYEICQPSAKTYTWQGILENRDFSSGELAYTSSALYPGQHIFGNSYTAAIDITQINFGNNMEATVYLYNTGSFNNWGTNNGETSNSPTNTNPGTYAAIPQNQAGQGGVQGQIPSMQGFLVKAMSNTTGNTLSIPYSSVAVKNTTLQRAKAANENDSDEKQYLRIDLKTDTVIVDRMWIFNEESCTRSFDNGWDGPKMLTENGTPALCAIEKDGLYQVNSVNNMDETKLGFRKGTATEYTLTFYPKNLQQRYPAVYLLDEATNKAIKIENEETAYTFTATGAGNLQQRFRIVARYYDKGETEGETQIKVFSSKSHIVIDNLSTENGEALIYDISGRKIAQEKFSGESITVYGNYPTGAYVVKAFTNKGTVTERIIVR